VTDVTTYWPAHHIADSGTAGLVVDQAPHVGVCEVHEVRLADDAHKRAALVDEPDLAPPPHSFPRVAESRAARMPALPSSRRAPVAGRRFRRTALTAPRSSSASAAGVPWPVHAVVTSNSAMVARDRAEIRRVVERDVPAATAPSTDPEMATELLVGHGLPPPCGRRSSEPRDRRGSRRRTPDGLPPRRASDDSAASAQPNGQAHGRTSPRTRSPSPQLGPNVRVDRGRMALPGI
jgi:hypothetical protein